MTAPRIIGLLLASASSVATTSFAQDSPPTTAAPKVISGGKKDADPARVTFHVIGMKKTKSGAT